jgi:radical SAM protein with 4Fe4S-binding SPASM domain
MTATRPHLQELARKHGVSSVSDFLAFPKFLQIETVAACNARCVMCPVEEWERTALLMNDSLYERILAELARHVGQIEMVAPQLHGEPLIDKKFESRVRKLKEIGIKKVAVSSNASLLNTSRSQAIVESGLDEITFSIDGMKKATFEAIRLRMNFDQCVSNILNFIDVRNLLKPQMRIRIRMTIMEANIGEYDDFLKYWSANLGPEDMAYGKLVHNWGSWLVGYQLPQMQDREEMNSSPCPSPWLSMVILSDGRVPLCCSDFNSKAEIGNVATSSIEEIWQSEAMTSYRQLHAAVGRKGMQMCVDCNVWDDASKITDRIEIVPQFTF